MNRREIMTAASVVATTAIAPAAAHAVAVAVPLVTQPIFEISGEHVVAYCTAPSLEAANRLFAQRLQPHELSAADVHEVTDDELESLGLRELLRKRIDHGAGDVQMLGYQPGGYH